MEANSVLPAFSRALQSFRSRLTQQDIDRFRTTSLQNLKDSISSIQTEQAGRQGLRNLSKIRPFLTGLEQYSRVIEVFVNADPLILAFIWVDKIYSHHCLNKGPIKFCLQVASSLTEAFDALLDAYEKIAESLPLFASVDRLFFTSHSNVQKILVNVYEDILDFHKRSIVFFKSRTWRIALKFTCYTFDNMFGDLLKRLERSKEYLLDSANIAHFHEAQEARMLFAEEFEHQTARKKIEQKLAVIGWLSAETCMSQHEEIQEKRCMYPRTTRWIYKLAQMRDWLCFSGTNSLVFWLSGRPGAGKTFLFSSIIETVTEYHLGSQMIFFYCKAVDPCRRTFDSIARGLLAQILGLNADCLDYMYDKMVSSPSHRNTAAYYTKMILEISVNHSRLVIGIDGLDECEAPERCKIMNLVNTVSEASVSQGNVKFFLTSRRERDIEQSLRLAVNLNIEPRYIEKDIAAYIEKRVSELGRVFTLSPAKEQQISADIARRPEGMFLLARLILDNLMSQETIQDLEEELQSEILPRGIEEAYGRILVRLTRNDRSERSRKRVHCILSVLVAAARPLHVCEINGALSVDLTQKSVSFEQRRLVAPIEELCGPIVEVEADDIVQLVHPTARGYLLQHYSGPYIQLSEAQMYLGTLSATYLAFSCFDFDLSDVALVSHTSTGDYAFQEYATSNWIHHCLFSLGKQSMTQDQGINVLLYAITILIDRHLERSDISLRGSGFVEGSGGNNLVGTKEKLQHLREIYEAIETLHCDLPPYLLQRVLQVRRVVERLAQKPTDWNDLIAKAYGHKVFRCPIILCHHYKAGFASPQLRNDHFAKHERREKCMHEHCDYSEVGFISKGDLERHIKLCHDALHDIPSFPMVRPMSLIKATYEAIDADDAATIRSLYVEVVASCTGERGFLLRAVKRKSWAAAMALIDASPDKRELDCSDQSGTTALHVIAETSGLDLMRKMLDSDVGINTEDRRGRTPFNCAVINRQFETAWMLIEDARIDLGTWQNRSVQGGTRSPWRAFVVAAEEGQVGILKAIIAARPDGTQSRVFTDTQEFGSFYAMVLNAAATAGQKSAVRILLDDGEQLNLRYRYPGPLRKAVGTSIDHAVTFLMAQGLDIRTESKIKPFRDAVLSLEIEKVAYVLAQNGKESYLKGAGYNLALGIAVVSGSSAIVQLLLEDIPDSKTIQGMQDCDLLLVAAQAQQTCVIDHLLKKLPLTCFSWSKTDDALYHAAKVGHWMVVELLVQCRYGPKMEFLNTARAFDAAAENGDTKIIDLLLSVESPLTSPGPSNALLRAAQAGHLNVVQKLLESGAPSCSVITLQSLLYPAVVSGHEQCVRMLLERSVDADKLSFNATIALIHVLKPEEIDFFGIIATEKTKEPLSSIKFNALHLATYLGKVEIVQIMLAHGTDVNIADGGGLSALQIASRQNSKDIVQKLLVYGAHVDADLTDPKGLTALQLAVMNGRTDNVRILLDHGASTAIPGATYSESDDYIFLEQISKTFLTEEKELAKLIQILQGLNPVNTSLRAKAKEGSKLAQILLDHACIPFASVTGLFALPLAVIYGQSDIVDILFNHELSTRSTYKDVAVSGFQRTAVLKYTNLMSLLRKSKGLCSWATLPVDQQALRDYQMQLTLLERQNKKRLLISRIEHDYLDGQSSLNGDPWGSQALQEYQTQLMLLKRQNETRFPLMTSPEPSVNEGEYAARLESSAGTGEGIVSEAP